MWNFLLYHLALRARLLRRPNHCHTRYVWGRRELPLRLPTTKELNRADAKFQTLKALEPVPTNMKLQPPHPPLDVFSFHPVDLQKSGLVPESLPQSKRGKGAHESRPPVPDGVFLEASGGSSNRDQGVYGACHGRGGPRGEYAILKHWYRNASKQATDPSQTDIEKVRGDLQTL